MKHVNKLKLNIRSLALAKGIANANQFRHACGTNSTDMASKLFNNAQTMFSIQTLQMVCNTLGCTPNQIFGLPEPLAPLPVVGKPQPEKAGKVVMQLPPQSKAKAKPVQRADGKAARLAKSAKPTKKATTLRPHGRANAKKGGK